MKKREFFGLIDNFSFFDQGKDWSAKIEGKPSRRLSKTDKVVEVFESTTNCDFHYKIFRDAEVELAIKNMSEDKLVEKLLQTFLLPGEYKVRLTNSQKRGAKFELELKINQISQSKKYIVV